MRKRFVILPAFAMLATLFGGLAQAHHCDDPTPECETQTVPNWRDGNYIPLFDLEDRDDPDQRNDAQRWKDECDNWQPGHGGYQSRQMCFWMYGGFSAFPNRDSDPNDPNSYAPNEWHAGFAASHCFLFEFAHQCEDHNAPGSEGTHDAHGGAIYADVCLTENPESKYCDDGLEDTQVGVTIMDHNPCGTVVPIVACTDEYHVIRPFDTEYTTHQMEDSQEYLARIAEDPELYLCGYHAYRSGNPVCPEEGGEGDSGVVPASALIDAARARDAAGVAAVMDAARAATANAGSARMLATKAPAGATPVAPTSAGSIALVALVLAAFVARATIRRPALR